MIKLKSILMEPDIKVKVKYKELIEEKCIPATRIINEKNEQKGYLFPIMKNCFLFIRLDFSVMIFIDSFSKLKLYRMKKKLNKLVKRIDLFDFNQEDLFDEFGSQLSDEKDFTEVIICE